MYLAVLGYELLAVVDGKKLDVSRAGRGLEGDLLAASCSDEGAGERQME